MTSLRKYLYGLIAVLIMSSWLIVSLAADQNTVKVNILMPAPFDDSTREIIRQFNKENQRKIEVNITRGPRETEAVSDLAISSLILGKSPYDAILMDVTWLPKYVEAGWLTPLDEWFTTNEISKVEEGAQRGNTYKGVLYRWPLVADIGMLYWRTDLMKKPPDTPYELVEISKELQKEGKVKYGYVWQGRQYEGLSCVFLEVITGFGGEWIDENGKVQLNENSNIRAVTWMNNLIKEGVTPKSVTNFSEPEALQSFKSGNAAFMRNWPYAWKELQKADSKVKGKVGVSTMVAENKENKTATLGSWGLAITKSSIHQNEVAEVIKYLTNEDSQRKLYSEFGYTPTASKVFNDYADSEENGILNNLRISLSASKPRPMVAAYAQISDILQRHLSAIFTDSKDVKKEIYKAQENTEKVMISAGIYKK